MTAKAMMQTAGAIFKGIWKRHQINVALVLEALFETRRLTVTGLGRGLRSASAPKHAIKRVDRFLGNPRFDHRRGCEQLLRAVVGPRRRVVIAIDWTKCRRWPVLVAAVVHRGRAVPVLWSVAHPATLYKSQNAFEHGFVTWLRSALPPQVQATVLLDRGFKRVDIIKHLRGLDFVIRTSGNVHVRSTGYCGPMDQLLVRRGQRCDLKDAQLRPSRPVSVRVVGLWDARSKEPWLLMTNLTLSPTKIIALYALRFRIEEAFRDQKDWRYGLQVGHTLVRKPERLERLLLLAALALFVALLIGTTARQRGLDRLFRANTVRNRPTHSDFTLGLHFALRIPWSRSESLKIFYAEGAAVFRG